MLVLVSLLRGPLLFRRGRGRELRWRIGLWMIRFDFHLFCLCLFDRLVFFSFVFVCLLRLCMYNRASRVIAVKGWMDVGR